GYCPKLWGRTGSVNPHRNSLAVGMPCRLTGPGLVADDHHVVRRMVRSTLESHSHIEVCGEAQDGAEAVEAAKKTKPDVIVLDISMPVLNGFEAAREIKKHLPEAAIVILSTHADKFFVEAAKRLGVKAYVAKSKVGEALVKAVEAAVKGEDFILME
ncbi:MAG: response regulator, partial [Terriglobales bacterium]